MTQKTNYLTSSLSPYLLQHQYNPVDWYPWGMEALDRARREDKPIFLSIGYSACHWCHVMERESFEDQKVAELLNEHFVSIKVDREERPDLDHIYMSYMQAMTGHGGWPMSIFMTPDLKPFLTGTYFPPTPRYGIPGFYILLLEIARLWKQNRSQLVSSSEKIFQILHEEEGRQQRLQAPLSEKLLEGLVAQCQRDYDPQWGGFSKAPKFPQAGVLFALMQQVRSQPGGGMLERITHTLEQMARGGIYDQVGGGFHRYSVDEKWLVPHFEKMLPDNALLSRLYLEAYQMTKQKPFLDTALNTLQYLLREMRDPLGGFYSSEDADSEGEEGKFYLWSLSEIEQNLLKPELFCRVYGVTKEGNFEGENILHQVEPIWTLPPQEQSRLAQDRQALLTLRGKRIRPGLDDKILIDWNALVISSLAKAYQVTGLSQYLEAAQKAAEFIESHMTQNGQLYHVWRQALGPTPAFLEDYANYILALLDLYESDFNNLWLMRAKSCLGKMVMLFWDQEGGSFYATSSEHDAPLPRKKTFHDEATPAGNAQAALALLRLGSYYESEEYNQMAEKVLSAQAAIMQGVPKSYGTMLCAVDTYLSSIQQIILVGDPSEKKIQELLRIIYDEYLPHKILAVCDERTPPLCKGKNCDQGLAFVCYRGCCYPPVSDPAQIRPLLSKDFSKLQGRK